MGFLGEGAASPYLYQVGGNSIACVDCVSLLCKSLNPVTFGIRSSSKNTVMTKKTRHQINTNYTDIFLTNDVCSLISVLKMSTPKSRGDVPLSNTPPMDLRPWFVHSFTSTHLHCS